MRAQVIAGEMLLTILCFTVHATAQTPPSPPDAGRPAAVSPPQQPAPTPKEIIERLIAREKAELEAIDQYRPIIETYIQEVRPDKELGIVPKSDFYFLGQADFRGRLKVHSLLETEKKGTWMWTYNPAGFLQMIFVDRGEFDTLHYRFKYTGREFLGEVRCYVFDVTPAPKTRNARFVGRIWVEDRDMNVVRFNGRYTPAIHFSLKTFEDEYYLHFDSWRTNVKSGLWLPTYIFSEEIDRPLRFSGPRFKAQTHLWGYQVTTTGREAELSRLLVESSAAIKDEAPQRDRSPLEAQREWRHEAENNVLDLLERNGLVAPQGEVDKVLNTIIKNIEITNNVDEQIDLHCRVLLTSNLEIFSVGNTVVLSRGLIDVVPDEATMAAMLAHGIADAMLPKPYQDQYAFSDVMRLTATEVLKHLSFQEAKNEAAENSTKALELLKKSPYAAKLSTAGLFLAQLHAQSRQLPRLISPQLGNEVYFESQLLQGAPALTPNSKDQVPALPMGSRLKIDPWTAGVSLRKSRPISMLSARDKMPFEVTPMVPYLTRYVETSSSQAPSGSFTGLN
ncbi:MAG TPA: hypothetical protein VE263_13295 [Candidatus Angelobacter sp.]|nr:hypothetical protein [Candidatus Angelobacter sp.]